MKPEDATPAFVNGSAGGAGSRARLIWLMRCCVALLGAIQVWVYRSEMNNDGLFYLDVARTYASGDWAAAVNGFWSPLYSWIMAPLVLLIPSPQQEFAAVHALSFLLFLLVLAAYDLFLRELFRTLQGNGPASSKVFGPGWWACGYALFAYASLVMVNLGRVGPDILVAASIYVASALLLRLKRTNTFPFWRAVGLGVTLGLGYFAKSVLFPISLVILATTFALVLRRRRGWMGAGIAAVVFGLIAGPWATVLSNSKQRLTFGDAGRLNYAWKVNNVPISHWQGDSLHGSPLHPTRKLSNGPVVYEFATPIHGTYPVWQDPSYWFDGIQPRFTVREQLRRVMNSVGDYLSSQWFYPLLLGILTMGFLAGLPALEFAARQTWFLLVPSAAGLSAYTLVLISDRYIAPFAMVGSLALLAGMASRPVDKAQPPERHTQAVPLAMATVFAVMVAGQMWFVDRLLERSNHFATSVRVAQLGVPRGSNIGMIGGSPNAYWAHLARDTIVAEIMPDEANRFWSLQKEERTRLLDLFRRRGAVAVVADRVPGWADRDGWVRVGNTAYWVHLLQPVTPTPPAG